RLTKLRESREGRNAAWRGCRAKSRGRRACGASGGGSTMRFASVIAAAVLLGVPGLPVDGQEDPPAAREEPWPESLLPETPQEGFELAVTLARRAVSTTQTDRDVLSDLRRSYANDASDLIAVSHVVAVHFQTVAAANGYWRSPEAAGSN